MDSELKNYLESGKHLPELMRDFHDQKNLFKSIHYLYQDDANSGTPNWIDGHVYAVDWFLWFMASRGYTLQKSRKKNVNFSEWPDFKKLAPLSITTNPAPIREN